MQIFTKLTELSRTYPRRTLAMIIGGGFVLAAIIGLTLATYFNHRNKVVSCVGDTCPQATATSLASPRASATTPPTGSPVPAALTGELVPPGKDHYRPLAVIIENHPDARPQSGLSSAGLVYEADTEGGITRFLSVFTDPTADIKVGPIRSARTFFVDMVTELNALFAHVGGNADALDQISATNVANLDQFSVGAPVYERDHSRNVATEHTMYSSTKSLWTVATESRKMSAQADFPLWTFVDDAPTASRATTQTVDINFSSASYRVGWTYDPTTNLYSRTLAGAPHIDANTGAAITTKNIVIQTVEHRPTTTRINEQGWIFTLTGSGPAKIIHNGQVVDATWKKEGTGRTRYYAKDGSEISFVRGTTWVELTHPETPVTIK